MFSQVSCCSGIVAGKVDGEIVGRSHGKNLDLNSVDKMLNYQDCEVVVLGAAVLKCNLLGIRDPSRKDIKALHVQCRLERGIACLVQVGKEDIDVGDDECQASSKCGDGEGGRRSGCGIDPFEITQRSSRKLRLQVDEDTAEGCEGQEGSTDTRLGRT